MTDQPDIFLIMTDQQRYDTIAALGAGFIDTPNIDRLVASGVTFDNCIIPSASCVPCRASVFSGLYPHTSGVYRNGDPWSKTWASQLQDAGYYTVNIGKMHTVPYDAPAGFDERFVVENKDRYLDGRWFFDEWDKAIAHHGEVKPQRELYRKRPDYDQCLGAFEWELSEHLHSDNFVGNYAQWWLETKPVSKPLFMQIGFPGPHPPYDPTPDLIEKYMARDDLPMPRLTKEDLDNLPPAFKEKRVHDSEVDHDSVVWNLNASADQLRRMRAYYYANVEMIDRQVGDIIAVIEKTGRLDNSIVIFTSDHGDSLGDHGLSQKWNMYEEVVRVPLIISAPGRFPGGRSIKEQVQLHDIAPTILEWANAEPAHKMEAISLNPALRGEAFPGRTYTFCEQGGDHNLTGCELITMVRSSRHKLVHFKDQPHGQLFDLETDPFEEKNLWDDPDYADTKAELIAALHNWIIDSNFQMRDVYADAR